MHKEGNENVPKLKLVNSSKLLNTSAIFMLQHVSVHDLSQAIFSVLLLSITIFVISKSHISLFLIDMHFL